jgi:transposase
MIIIGVDFHPEFQQASVDTDTREVQEKRLGHQQDAEAFYRALAAQKVRVGMEASGPARWFERLMASCSLSCGLETRRNTRYQKTRFDPLH